MQKLLLVSILIADVVIPVWASRRRNGRKALKKTLVGMLIFNAMYLLALLFIYPRL